MENATLTAGYFFELVWVFVDVVGVFAVGGIVISFSMIGAGISVIVKRVGVQVYLRTRNLILNCVGFLDLNFFYVRIRMVFISVVSYFLARLKIVPTVGI